jgi:hypothetical protein
LNWVATEDGNGASFAPVTPSKGTLQPLTSVILTITPNVASKQVGTLITVITIADSDVGTKVASQNIAVTINIVDQANIALSTNSITMTNTSTSPQSSTLLVISNTGSRDLNWAIVTDISAPWLSVDISSGTLAAGNNAIVNVHCNSTTLVPGIYKATLLIKDSDPGTPVPSQTISIALVVQ